MDMCHSNLATEVFWALLLGCRCDIEVKGWGRINRASVSRRYCRATPFLRALNPRVAVCSGLIRFHCNIQYGKETLRSVTISWRVTWSCAQVFCIIGKIWSFWWSKNRFWWRVVDCISYSIWNLSRLSIYDHAASISLLRTIQYCDSLYTT